MYVCLSVCEREKKSVQEIERSECERERVCERKSVCERQSACVCEKESVCVRERVRERDFELAKNVVRVKLLLIEEDDAQVWPIMTTRFSLTLVNILKQVQYLLSKSHFPVVFSCPGLEPLTFG